MGGGIPNCQPPNIQEARNPQKTFPSSPPSKTLFFGEQTENERLIFFITPTLTDLGPAQGQDDRRFL